MAILHSPQPTPKPAYTSYGYLTFDSGKRISCQLEQITTNSHNEK
jgi:hypothetical protein